MRKLLRGEFLQLIWHNYGIIDYTVRVIRKFSASYHSTGKSITKKVIMFILGLKLLRLTGRPSPLGVDGLTGILITRKLLFSLEDILALISG